MRAEPAENAAKHTTGWRVNPKLYETFAVMVMAERERRRQVSESIREAMRCYKAEPPGDPANVANVATRV